MYFIGISGGTSVVVLASLSAEHPDQSSIFITVINLLRTDLPN